MNKKEKAQLESILAGHPFKIRPLLQGFLEEAVIVEEETVGTKQRTGQQNKALHLFFQLVADELIKNGVTMRSVFEKTSNFDIPPSKENVREVWIHFQKALYGTERTRDLKKQGEIDRVHEVMMKNLGEMFHIDYIGFPVDEQKQAENMKGYKSGGKVSDYPEYQGPPTI